MRGIPYLDQRFAIKFKSALTFCQISKSFSFQVPTSLTIKQRPPMIPQLNFNVNHKDSWMSSYDASTLESETELKTVIWWRPLFWEVLFGAGNEADQTTTTQNESLFVFDESRSLSIGNIRPWSIISDHMVCNWTISQKSDNHDELKKDDEVSKGFQEKY